MGNTIPRHREFFIRTGLVCFGLAAGVLLVEGFLRAREALTNTSSENETVERATLRLHVASDDPVLKYGLRPGAAVERDGTIYRVNAQGFRANHDVQLEKRGKRRILLLGDSVAFGLGVDYEDTFGQLIERQLTANGMPTEVLNLSVLGYKTSQEVRMLERRGWQLNPDGVILAFCLNDFDDFSGELPLFDPSGRLPPGGYQRLPPRRLGSIELPEPMPLLDRSLLFRKLSGRLRVDYYRWIGTDRALRKEVAEAIGRLGKLLSERGIPGLVAIFPLLHQLDDYPYEDIHQFIASEALAAGLSVADLTTAFRSERTEVLRVRPGDVLHLSKVGHAITARALIRCTADAGLRCRKRDVLP
jgi:lysophospholipase L1-like esterase